MNLPVVYGEMTIKQRRLVREEYTRRQNGLCQYCQEHLSDPPAKAVRDAKILKKLFPPGFFIHPVHLHHDHNTGLTIGAVHNHCNAVLWQYHGE
jgi:hypothetical protein